jgi:hypothetical protein
VTLLRDLEIRNDPWNVEYGAEIPALSSEHEEAAKNPPALDVEVPAEEWSPRQSLISERPLRVFFLDGVRRVEHRVLLRTRYHGAFGSFAVGAVVVENSSAEYADIDLHRVLVVGTEEPSERREVAISPTLRYRLLPTSDDDVGELGTGAIKGVDAPLRTLQNAMRKAEEELGRKLATDPNSLVVLDGPLTFAAPRSGAAVGYIKRITRFYIPPEKQGLLARLPAGTRTPLFEFEGRRRFARYSWFLRLAAPCPGDSQFSGIVRLEVAKDGVSVEKAVHLADVCTYLLPQFASRRGLDPRAPQNLVPVGALEAHLRRQLGDVQLLNRYLRAAIAREASRA